MIPKISVIMGVYNSEKTLEEALDSIFKQTYKNFEVIICDDGSTDNSFKLLKKIKEANNDKVILLQNKANLGLNYTLNKCLDKATGEYIARMDSDDISIATRFEKQISFLEENKEYSIVSSAMIFFDSSGDYAKNFPIEKPKAKDFMITNSPFAHAAAMVRKEAYYDVNGYTVDDNLLRVEDFNLWTKMYAKGYKGYNFKEPLYKMRNDINAINRRKFKFRVNEAYAKSIAVRELNLPKYNYFYTLVPIIKGIVPKFIYKYVHKRKLKKGLQK